MTTRRLERLAIGLATTVALLLGPVPEALALATRETAPRLLDIALDPRAVALAAAFVLAAWLGTAGRWRRGRP